MIRSARRGLEFVPLGLLRMLAPRPHVSLLYHLCSDGPLAHVDPLYSYKTPAEFEQDLVYLRRHFLLVAHEQVRGHYEGGSPLPANAVELSFDDGLAECFSLERPLLLQYGIPSTFFIITNLVDNGSLMFRHRIALCLDPLGRLSEADASSTLRELSAAEPANDSETPRFWN